MTKDQYLHGRRDAREEYENRIQSLNMAYVSAHTPYSIGDIITDHDVIILISSIKPDEIPGSAPKWYYFGRELRKDLKFKKKSNMVCISCFRNTIKLN